MTIMMSDDEVLDAAAAGDLSAVKAALDAGFDVNRRGTGHSRNLGWTMLHKAIIIDDENLVEFLLCRGADPNLRFPVTDETPLYDATRVSCGIIMSLLVNHGADINAVSGCDRRPSNRTALWFACWCACSLKTHRLLKLGADPNIPDSDGNTPMHIACTYGYPKKVELLLAYGARADTVNNLNQTPIDILLTSQRTKRQNECLALFEAGSSTKAASRRLEPTNVARH